MQTYKIFYSYEIQLHLRSVLIFWKRQIIQQLGWNQQFICLKNKIDSHLTPSFVKINGRWYKKQHLCNKNAQFYKKKKHTKTHRNVRVYVFSPIKVEENTNMKCFFNILVDLSKLYINPDVTMKIMINLTIQKCKLLHGKKRRQKNDQNQLKPIN